ncbi:MAG: hypothetical protein DHS20C12_30670 [Pseudohongiella sp.]|nr:MAG: hypothetical protein DHS20C12_30670 [Pseudohongiella sp.]
MEDLTPIRASDSSKSPQAEGSAEQPIQLPFLKFLLKATLWSLGLFYLSSEAAAGSLGFMLIAVLVVSTPIALAGIYGATVNQIRGLEIFARRGLLYRLLSGRPLKIAFWIVWALLCGFYMLLQFQLYGTSEWLLFFLVVPVFWFCYRFCRNLLRDELKPYLLTNQSLLWSRWLAPAIMVFLHIILLAVIGEAIVYDSVSEAISATGKSLSTGTGSAVIGVASSYLSYYEGLKLFAIGRLGMLDSLLALSLVCVASYVVFFNACVMLSSLLIPRAEYRRLLTPLSNSDFPEEINASTVGLSVAVTTFLTLFICLPTIGYLEAWLQRNPEVGLRAQQSQAQVTVRLEQIDELFFNQGTLEQLEQARILALQNVDSSLALVEQEAEQAFLLMEGNVDSYLNWYYSLTAEYGRIGTLLVGNLEEYMTQNLREVLTDGDVFASVEQAFASALAEHDEARRVYQRSVEEIMAANRVEPAADSLVEVSERMVLEDVLRPPVHEEFVNFDQRMRVSGGGAAAGAVGGVIVAKVIAKVAGKSTIKLAATATSKVVASKAIGSSAGAGAGAVAGAAIGSVIPGLGTAVGAVIGGVVSGVVVGVTIDKALIEIDELMNREEFRAELVAAIHDARDEFLGTLR